MPGKVKVRIVAGRNLPVMDRSSDTTDAYVEVKLGTTTHKTDVYRKSLNPSWNSEWFRFEVDDLELQDEPLQVRLMDHDTYSANDAIGKVYIDLNPLLLPPIPTNPPNKLQSDQSQGTSVMSGWLPVYDTMHGIRGEVNIIVKVDLFTDFNKFRQSSCGVQFFFTPEIPAGYRCQSIVGFVEELVVNDDPEYQWIDKIRTPRASNEARQTLFSKLSGELQRRIGLKVLDLGGNAVIGYRQCFDLEGESGIVVRGVASAVNLVRLHHDLVNTGGMTTHSPSPMREVPIHRDHSDQVSDTRTSLSSCHAMCGSPKRTASRSRHTSGCYPMSRSPQPSEADTLKSDANGTQGPTHSPTHSGKIASPARTPGVSINRRSSDSDLSLTPKGGSLTGSGGSSGGRGCNLGMSPQRPIMTQESFDMLEYPFLTMKTFPHGFILHFGGSVSARSVKLLDRGHTPEEVETRDSWWSQLRTEIRSHTRALACNVVLGYEEYTTICDEVCVLNAQGTAAVIRIHNNEGTDALNSSVSKPKDIMCTSFEKNKEVDHPNKVTKDTSTGMTRSHPSFSDDVMSDGGNMGTCCNSAPPSSTCKTNSSSHSMPCSMCHVPYSDTSLPFKVKISKCGCCRRGKVADVLFTTVELPSNLPVLGRGCLIQARVARTKRELKGELNAKEISDSLPFLEYELHKQLINKMKIKGMNALFSLRVRVTVGERLVVGVATATAVFLTSLPHPALPRVTTAGSHREEEIRRLDAQRLLQDTLNQNRLCYGINQDVPNDDIVGSTRGSDTDDSDDDMPDAELSLGNKDVCVLELDDVEDAEMISQLVESCAPNQLVTVTTQTPPGVPPDQIVTNLQMFTKIWRAKIPANPNQSTFNHYFDRLLQSVVFKVRKLSPCYLSGLKFDVEIPEEDELQITLLGMILGQGSTTQKLLSGVINEAVTNGLECDTKKTKQGSSDNEMIFKMEELGPSEETTGTITSIINSKPNKTILGVRSLHDQPSKFQATNSCLSFNSVPSTGSFPSAQSVLSFPSVPSASSFSSGSSSARSSLKHRSEKKPIITYHCCPTSDRFGVEITPLSFIPGGKVDKHLGNLNFFFIRESTSIKEVGGLSGFMGSFVTEVLALIRAHVAALGGNAMISYFMSECVLFHNPHKNQGQCLINVGGDVVQVSYLGTATEISATKVEE